MQTNNFNKTLFWQIMLFGIVFFQLFSGVIIYISPEATSAQRIGYEIFSIDIKAWRTLFYSTTIINSVIVLIFLVRKIKVAVKQNSGKVQVMFQMKEFLFALGIIALVSFLALSDTLPFSYISNVRNNIIASYGSDILYEKSIDENSTLVSIARDYPNATESGLMKILSESGLKVQNSNMTVFQIADANKFPVSELIRLLEEKSRLKQNLRISHKQFREKTIQDFSKEWGVSTGQISSMLIQKKILASVNETMFEISKKYSVPESALEMIVAEVQSKIQKQPLENTTGNSELVAKSIATISKEIGVNPNDLILSASKSQLKISGIHETLGEIAKRNRMSVSDVYNLLYRPNISNEIKSIRKPVKASLTQNLGDLTLAEVCDKYVENGFDVNIELVFKRLAKNGIRVEGTKQTLNDLGSKYAISPQKLLEIISGNVRHVSGKEFDKFNPANTVEKPISDIAIQLGMSTEKILDNLKKAGITASEKSTILELSEETGKASRDIVRLMKGE